VVIQSIAPRLALAALALGGLGGWTYTLDGPTQRTREKLQRQYEIVESYRLTHGRLPTPREYLAYRATLIPDKAERYELQLDGWGRCMKVCLYGDKLVLLSLGPNGVYEGGGVDDLSIEIEP